MSSNTKTVTKLHATAYLIVPITYIGWSLWLIVSGVVLLVG